MMLSVELQPAYGFLDACVGDGIAVTCTVTTFVIYWKVNGESEGFTKSSTENSVKMVGNFEIILVSTGPKLVSTATQNDVTPNHNGTVLTCSTNLEDNPSPEDAANITIIVQGTALTYASLETITFPVCMKLCVFYRSSLCSIVSQDLS